MNWTRRNIKAISALTLLGVMGCAAMIFPVSDWVNAFAGWIRSLGSFGALIFVVVFAVAALVSLPASLFTAAAGLVYGVAAGATIAFFGAVLSATLGFLLARYVFRDQVEMLARRHDKFAAIDRALGAQGWKVIGLLRISPLLPLGLSTYLFGVTSVRFWPYFFASALGVIPGTLLYAYLGAIGRVGLAGGAHQRGWLEWALLIAGLVATAAVTLLVGRTAKNALGQQALGVS
jgi:uncharacterized membrane protein YdjX (TVP38/TMEM64 family)